MLTYSELASLHRELAGQNVLSVYLNGETSDPAARGQWRIDLRNRLDAIESSLAATTHTQREAFAACRRMVVAQSDTFTPGAGSPGWIGFFTTAGMRYGKTVPVAVPTEVTWGALNLAPYIRVLKEARPVVVAVVDNAQVKVHRYAVGGIAALETLAREVAMDTPYHMSRPARTGFHTGTRGRTGTDAAQREFEKASHDLFARAAASIEQAAGADGWIVIGGIAEASAALFGHLPAHITDRARQAVIDVHARPAQLAEIARTSASLLRDRENHRAIDEALSAAAARGAGAAGLAETTRALELAQVKSLFLSSSFLREHGTVATKLVQLALTEGAEVEHVSGEAAVLLDQAGGVAARLRYVPPREQRSAPVAKAGATSG